MRALHSLVAYATTVGNYMRRRLTDILQETAEPYGDYPGVAWDQCTKDYAVHGTFQTIEVYISWGAGPPSLDEEGYLQSNIYHIE